MARREGGGGRVGEGVEELLGWSGCLSVLLAVMEVQGLLGRYQGCTALTWARLFPYPEAGGRWSLGL